MTKRKISISTPVVGEEEWLAVKDPLFSGWLTQGPKVSAFETDFAKLHGVSHALATTSCTTAMHLILAALEVGPGDEVIIPAFTWIATANVVAYCGATPVFVDVDPLTYNIDPADVERKLTRKTKALIAVHLFGLCADVGALQKILPEDVLIIEDAACAAGAKYKEKSAGSLGVAGAFSFHPRKSITTGEGGMVTTNDPVLAQKMEMMRNHGASISEEQRHQGPKPYLLPDFNLLGFNYRMTDLQGAVGHVQLSKLVKFITERQKWANYYCEHLADLEWLKMPSFNEDCSHAWQAFVTYVDPEKAPMPRNDIMECLEATGIATRPGTHAVHMLSYYQNRYQIEASDFPNAWLCDQNTMAIPLHNNMCQEDFDYVIEHLHMIGQ